MNKIIYSIPCLLILFIPFTNQAQPYYGYQTIGLHTVYFSFAWHDKPMLGVGYNFRISGEAFTDVGLEWRFPVESIYDLSEHQIIGGMYRPLKLENRGFTAIGIHGRINKKTSEDGTITQYGLALSVLPSYTYAASLTDGAYGTVGLRICYQPVLFSQIKTGDGTNSTQILSQHRVELGGHIDLHLERTFGLSSNGFLTRSWAKNADLRSNDTESWKMEGDLYIGSTYYLKRW